MTPLGSCLNLYPVAIRTGPVHRLVLDNHAGFLTLLIRVKH